jgi:2-dehydro-3-deoxygalactonokinase
VEAQPLIGVDWGTSNLRAFRYAPDGDILDLRRSDRGMGGLRPGDFEAALREVIGDWLEAPARLLVSGMAGAREGWIEAPYAPCPADLASLAAALIPIPTKLAEAYIVPGLVAERPGEARGIMRGEETQIFGVIDAYAVPLVIAPGTHSKWARIDNAAVADISTFMTGEVFALMKSHSILARLIEGEVHDADAFALGLKRAREDSALLRLLFTARSEGLFGAVAPAAMASYLSGLVIGSEVAAGLARADAGAPILLIAAPALAALYETALNANGAKAISMIDGETASARGLWRIAGARGLV